MAHCTRDQQQAPRIGSFVRVGGRADRLWVLRERRERGSDRRDATCPPPGGCRRGVRAEPRTRLRGGDPGWLQRPHHRRASDRQVFPAAVPGAVVQQPARSSAVPDQELDRFLDCSRRHRFDRFHGDRTQDRRSGRRRVAPLDNPAVSSAMARRRGRRAAVRETSLVPTETPVSLFLGCATARTHCVGRD